MTNLAQRLATAFIAIPVLLASIFLGPPLLTVAVVAVAGAIGLWEFFSLLAARGIAGFRFTGGLLAGAFFLQIALPETLPVPVLPVAAILLLLAALTRAGDIPGSITATAGTLLGAVYLGGLPGTMAALRTFDRVGPWGLMMLLAIVMAADSLAYFTGSTIGRHKLAPAISPGKTVEGLVGGLVGGVLGALVVRWLGLPWLPLAHAVGLGLSVSALGVAGDLFESLLKRWAGVKDSGTLFPGHGGMLDRLDSLLLSAPVLYYYFLYAR